MNAAGLAAVLATLLVVALTGLAWAVLSRRAAGRRVDAATAVMRGAAAGEDRNTLAGATGLDRALDRLEHTVADAVDQRRAAGAARDRLSWALGAIESGIVIFDERGGVVYRNDPAASFLGARHGGALVEEAIEELAAVALRGEGAERELVLYGPPRRVMDVRAAPLADPARPSGALVVVEDISERWRLENVRRDFVANISHELKTPVGALALLAETLLDEDDIEVTHRLAERVSAEAFRVGRTIDELLELSRIEAGTGPAAEPVAIDAVVGEAVDRVRPAAEQRDIAVVVDEPDRPLTVTGEHRQLVSAVANLVENAVKYSEPGSTVEVGARTDGRWVDVAVRDHGIGIPQRELERIFERFYRVDEARSRDTGGTGLGLAIVRHVASNHGGEVRVESREGVGSTFTLRLPADGGRRPPSTAEEAV
ncbi:MAG: sensor histidine kinase [Acidimicrobiia bacterium]